MADISYHHGVAISESPETPVLIRTAQSAVVLLLGTAPDADADAFPLDEPILLKGASDASLAAKLGADGTLRDAVDAVWAQTGAYTYVIRAEEGADAAATMANMVGSRTALTGVHAAGKIEGKYGPLLQPRLWAAPGFTAALTADGLASVTVTAGGSGYGEDATITITGDGTGAAARPIVSGGVVTGAVITNPGRGYSEITLAVVDAAGTGATLTGTIGSVGNPLAHEMVGLLDEIGAFAFLDGPAISDEAAVTAAGHYGSARLYMVEPMGQVYDADLGGYVSRPGSAYFAGVQAWTDRQMGFAHTLSNKRVAGIDGVNRPMRYGPQTDYLNENRIGTMINRGDGWRCWGARSLSSDPVWAFMNVRRTADFINEALKRALFNFVDRLPTEANLRLMIESGQNFLNTLRAEGFIIRGKVWIDPDKNSSSNAAQGIWTLSVSFEPYAPMEQIRGVVHRDIPAYDLLIDTIGQSISDGGLSLG